MPNPKPTFDKTDSTIFTDAIDEILEDLGYAIDDYNTKFGRGMLSNAIRKLKALRKM